MNRSHSLSALFSALLGVLVQGIWLLPWPLPDGQLQSAASLAGPAVLFFVGVFTVWKWRRCGSLAPFLGGSLGTMLLWAIVLVRNDADEVGVPGAMMEGVVVGALYASLGGAPFLITARLRSRARS
jgi:hypothetical protein